MHATSWLLRGLIGAAALSAISCSLEVGGLSGLPADVSGATAGPATGAASSSSAGEGSVAASSGSGGGTSGAGGGTSGAGGGTSGAGGGTSGAGGSGGAPPIAVAGKLLVALDANDLTTGSTVWDNQGSLGDFNAVGAPKVGALGTVQAVQFDGQQDAYVGPISAGGIEGNSRRSIEVWVNNPTVDSEEETMVSWSDRGGPDGTMMSFNYGTSGSFGAMTHWGPSFDMGWGGGPPAPNQWHHLAYTYDGTTARVYADGAEKSNRKVQLNTKKMFPINVAAQRYKGMIQFKNEFYQTQQAGSLWIAIVRIHDDALTAEQVNANFMAESPRFR